MFASTSEMWLALRRRCVRNASKSTPAILLAHRYRDVHQPSRLEPFDKVRVPYVLRDGGHRMVKDDDCDCREIELIQKREVFVVEEPAPEMSERVKSRYGTIDAADSQRER